MPNQSNDDRVQGDLNKLEDKFDRHSTDIQRMERNVGILEGKINSYSDDIEKLEKAVGEMRTVVDERTSASRTVTWSQLLMFMGAFVFVMGPLLTIVGTTVNGYFLPQRIEWVVLNSDKLKSDFGKTIDARLDEKLKPTNEILSTVAQNTKAIRDELIVIKSAVKTTVTRKDVVESLKHHSSRRRKDYDLHEVQILLAAVKELKIPLERQDYKDLSLNLYLQYLGTKDQDKKRQLLETFIQAANAKSISEPTLHVVPEAIIAQAKNSGNYFEGEVDLSSRAEWKGAVFHHCKITVSKPDVPVVLRDVRFLDCSFDSLVESPAVNLLSTYLESTRPTVTYPGYKVLVEYLGRVDR